MWGSIVYGSRSTPDHRRSCAVSCLDLRQCRRSGGRPRDRERAQSNVAGLDLLEVALPLPVGDGGVELSHFEIRSVDVVLDDIGAETFAGHFAGGEKAGGFAQG